MRAVKVSTRGDYASRALLSLALREDISPTSVRDIAERTGLPQPYLEQILLALKGAGLVRSKRGVGGGYVLARSPEQITLGQIVSAVDGPIVAGDFGQPHQNGACDHEGQCVLLAVWADVGEHMRHHLDSFTLKDMVLRGAGRGVAAFAAGLTKAEHGPRITPAAWDSYQDKRGMAGPRFALSSVSTDYRERRGASSQPRTRSGMSPRRS